MKSKLIIVFLLLLSTISLAAPKYWDTVGSSVVKIRTYFHDNTMSTATGWSWKDPMHIVTALHAVAGNKEIRVYKDKDYSTAKIVKVLKKADLALLKLDRDLALKPLEIMDVDPYSEEIFKIWGFPLAQSLLDEDDIKLKKTWPKYPTLRAHLTGDDTSYSKVKLELKRQGYPMLDVNILRIKSMILPGHSGAPIFSNNGKVIGIGDGGLRGGGTRQNWGIPAKKYMDKLLDSKDEIPKKISIQSSLYSSRVKLPAKSNEKIEKRLLADSQKRVKGYRENHAENGYEKAEDFKKVEVLDEDSGETIVLTKRRTASYSDVFEMLPEKAKSEFRGYEKEWGKKYFEKMSFDIYEDFDTGATFAVPRGASVLSGGSPLFRVEMKHVTYYFEPFNDDSHAKVKAEINMFIDKETIPKLSNPRSVKDMEDELEEDKSKETVSRYLCRQIKVDDKDSLALFGGKAKGNNAAIVYIETNSVLSNMSEDEFYEVVQALLSFHTISFAERDENEKVVITKTWSASYSDMFETLAKKAKSELLTYEEVWGRKYFEGMNFDIYEDFGAGAVFAVPKDVGIATDGSPLFRVEMKHVTYAFEPFGDDSHAKVKAEINNFIDKETIPELANPRPVKDIEDHFEEDKSEETFIRFLCRQLEIDGQKSMACFGGRAKRDVGTIVYVKTNNIFSNMSEDELYELTQAFVSYETISFYEN